MTLGEQYAQAVIDLELAQKASLSKIGDKEVQRSTETLRKREQDLFERVQKFGANYDPVLAPMQKAGKDISFV